MAAGSAGGALAGSLISGGTLAPAIGAATGGVVATGLNEMGSLNPLALASKASEVVVNKAPDNIFSVLQAATELLGWGLIGIFVLPLLLGGSSQDPWRLKLRRKRNEEGQGEAEWHIPAGPFARDSSMARHPA